MDFNKRPLSWSAIYSFEYDPEQWYRRYVLNEPQEPSREMIFGKKIGTMLEKDPTFLPQIVRLSKMEHPFKVVFNKIQMVGYADTFCDKTFKALGEYKTGKKAWTQKRVDEHGQIDMYLLMNWITNKIKPEDVDITLTWMPTEETGGFEIVFVEPIESNIKVFKTKRTMMDIINFGNRIKKTVEEMNNYIKSK